MPYVKPTVHLSRIAGTALKSFTHGYAQTVVAASQSSFAAQNTPTGPFADTLLGRVRKAEKTRLYHVLHAADNARHASTAAAPVRTDAGHGDAGLDKYFDAWQKSQRSGTKEWQQFQFARMIEWQPPTTIPLQVQDAEAVEQVIESNEKALNVPILTRSYTTSALDNFDKAFSDDEVAEAVALEQVNNAIAEEIQRSKDEGVYVPHSRESLTPVSSPRASPATASDQVSVSTPASLVTPVEQSSESLVQSDAYTKLLVQLAEDQRYVEVPATFQAMMQSSMQRPTATAYAVLLKSAIELTRGKHHEQVLKALEVYSSMLRTKVVPDAATFSTLIDLCAKRTSQLVTLKSDLETSRLRYGGLDEAGTFMFGSSQAAYAMLLEDSSLSMALRLFDRAAQIPSIKLSGEACASLIIACANHGRLNDMTRVYQHLEAGNVGYGSAVFPSMIVAFGLNGDLRSAVDVYNEYKDMAIANNAGANSMARIDNEVYAALVKSYGSVGRMKGALKFLASVQTTTTDSDAFNALRETVALQALLPLALKNQTFQNAFDVTRSLTGPAYMSAMTTIAIAAADKNMLDMSVQAFNTLTVAPQDLAVPAAAMLAMHIRNANLDAAEPFWAVLESAPAQSSFIEPTTMRSIALIDRGQAARALRQSRRMFARVRESQPRTGTAEVLEHIDEAISLMGNFMLKNNDATPPEANVELIRMMTDNGNLILSVVEHVIARLGPDQIAQLSAADIEFMLCTQGRMILEDISSELAGPARFACLLQTLVSRSILPISETETVIERTLINIDRADMSAMWNAYRYPQTPSATNPALYQPPPPPPSNFDESFDPYAIRTDVKGSNIINELLEHSQGRRMAEALAKFRNMRRVGRVPRMFTYSKLIESAAKVNDIALARELLELAKTDVPFDSRYRVVRFGWQQILDHMVAGCLTLGRRDLAARYHQDLLALGAAPSANTFGLYITTLKENTKTFDEASEAVKIFLRAKSEGVEPSSFLYNALIGKLGKARRIDDCLFYFTEMRNLGIRPTSVTYGTIVNALCRVSDEKFAEEIFEEMEECINYKPRPAPYHSVMQYFLTTKRDKSKVLDYYERMRSKGIEPTMHTYKLLIDTHATLEPINMPAAEAILEDMHAAGVVPETVHYASLIHAKGCVLHDMPGARALFNSVISEAKTRPLPCLYQALFESLNANHQVADSDVLVKDMVARRVEFTPYIANALIHGWTLEKDVRKAQDAFVRVPVNKREPSTYEAMARAYLAAEDRDAAKGVVREALSRGYPAAVANKIAELVR
nr:pentatricopeptide repeat-containing protein 5, mitochondrial [Quercus suber]